MNLARQNTPEQVQFYLLDFGANGLSPLKNLPHVVDITTADNVEKTNKLLGRIREELTKHKQLFTKAQVATFSQYNTKHKESSLPIQVVVLDNYDTIAGGEGNVRDKYDSLIAQLLREGASLGLYLILTANRVAVVKMSMQSNIQTKIALYLLNQDELIPLFGKDRLPSQEVLGRGQLTLDVPRSIQIYLPAMGENENQIQSALEAEIKEMDNTWQGRRPLPIPMVPDEVLPYDFINDSEVMRLAKHNVLPIGYDLASALPLGIMLDNKFFLLNYEDEEQQASFYERLVLSVQLIKGMRLIVVDPENVLKHYDIPESVQYFNESKLSEVQAVIEAVTPESPAIIYVMSAERYLPTLMDDVALN
jgi:S-DNA-T family DNA segregation ATPase FtsK/SpoIIIE